MRTFFFILLFVPAILQGQESMFAWQEFTIGAPAMTLSMPGKPLPQSTNLPESVLMYIKRYDGFFIKNDAKGLLLTVTHVAYSGDIVANAEGALKGTIDQWVQTGAKIEVQSTVQKSISGKPALIQKGLFMQGDYKKEFMDVVLTEGEKMWQLIVIVNANDQHLQEAVETILKSITFKAN